MNNSAAVGRSRSSTVAVVRGACRALGVFGLSYMLAVCALCPAGFYSLTGDPTAFGYYFGCVTNFMFACYKVTVMLARSGELRKIYQRIRPGVNAAPPERRWKARARVVSFALIAYFTVGAAIWVCSPFAFGGALALATRNRDGTSAAYRINVFNVYLAVSDHTHNAHFAAFYAAETAMFVAYASFVTLFDLVAVAVCFAFCGRLEAIGEAVGALGHGPSSTGRRADDDASSGGIDEKTNLEKTSYLYYDDLQNIINDHQNVLKSLSNYYAIFYPAILTEIFVGSSSHVVLWFIAATSIFNGELADSILSVKLMFALPVFTFQLFVKCYLFGTINEIKESFIFALYCSNWTKMDMKSKKLILHTMKMNNANKIKIKFTNTKIVNLEMFTHTMRVCYSLFSMLIKYNKNKNNINR